MMKRLQVLMVMLLAVVGLSMTISKVDARGGHRGHGWGHRESFSLGIRLGSPWYYDYRYGFPYRYRWHRIGPVGFVGDIVRDQIYLNKQKQMLRELRENDDSEMSKREQRKHEKKIKKQQKQIEELESALEKERARKGKKEEGDD